MVSRLPLATGLLLELNKTWPLCVDDHVIAGQDASGPPLDVDKARACLCEQH